MKTFPNLPTFEVTPLCFRKVKHEFVVLDSFSKSKDRHEEACAALSLDSKKENA